MGINDKKRGPFSRFLIFLFKTVLYAVLCVLIVLIVMNVFVPIYDYGEPKPFSGDYLHNPYQDMDPEYWKQCNFHAHTDQYGGVTDGRNTPNEVLDSVYNAFGFDHIGISDYMKINDYVKFRPGYIPAYEHGYNVFKIHQLCLGSEKVRYIDYFFFQNLSMKQHMINRLSQQNRLVVVAHPSFVEGSYKVKDMKYLSNYKLMEVLNGYCLSPEHWDMALSNGHLVYLIADDDSHNSLSSRDVACRFTMINAKENNADDLLEALVSGNAVGVDFKKIWQESLPDKRDRLEKDLPYLTKAELVDTIFTVGASKMLAKVQFIGQGGKILKEVDYVDEASYNIRPEDQYVRTVLYFVDGTALYLNPVTRHDSPDIIKQRLDHISYIKTTLLWLVYCFVISLIIAYISAKRRKNKRKNVVVKRY